MALTQLDSSQTSAFATTFIGLGRNRLINGDMIIDQQNGGASVTVNTSSQTFFVDQFSGTGISASGVFTAQRLTTTPPTGFTHYLHFACTTADASIAATDLYRFNYNVEGNIVRDFLLGSASAVAFTLSFWVRSTTTGTYTGSFRNAAINRSYPFEYSISSANTWEKKTITLTGDLTGTWTIDNSAGLLIEWCFALGTNFQGTVNTWQAGNLAGTSSQVNFMASNTNTYDITGVQLEIGSVATPFEFRSVPIEIALCQRYFEKSYAVDTAVATNTNTNNTRTMGAQTGATTIQFNVWYRVTKRTAATVTYYTNSGTSGSWDFTSTGGVTTTRTVTGITAGTYQNSLAQTASATEFYGAGHWIADARL